MKLSRRLQLQNSQLGAGGGGGSFPTATADDVIFDDVHGSGFYNAAFPTTMNAGDLLLLQIGTIGGIAALSITGTANYNEGWTLLEETFNTNTGWRSGLWTKTALGTETGACQVNVTSTGNLATGQFIRLNGAGVAVMSEAITPADFVTPVAIPIVPSEAGRVLSMAWQYSTSTAWVTDADQIDDNVAGNGSFVIADEGTEVTTTTGNISNSVSRAQSIGFAVLIGAPA